MIIIRRHGDIDIGDDLAARNYGKKEGWDTFLICRKVGDDRLRMPTATIVRSGATAEEIHKAFSTLLEAAYKENPTDPWHSPSAMSGKVIN